LLRRSVARGRRVAAHGVEPRPEVVEFGAESADRLGLARGQLLRDARERRLVDGARFARRPLDDLAHAGHVAAEARYGVGFAFDAARGFELRLEKRLVGAQSLALKFGGAQRLAYVVDLLF